ncbi:alkaline shock response membrane anchor protein AmaP [Brevibacillus fulvus]|uniref:Alkaline shock family protein YloU n=1 Tax=Brevibacillus fulvus TaxID=1125967 RepID=A0A938XX45_9BACL|nr:alkaline shock response membrane anchor protein AmaP [Brevibacillus fulvus]MBM7588584.1 putative alkaline shock family protein YloU [Brevibacillus fulvus]
MNLFDRFILTLYSFALIVISIVAIGVFAQFIPYSYVQNTAQSIFIPGQVNWPYLIVALIFFLISLRFFFSSFTRTKPRKEKGIRQRTDLGEVNITINTIQTIAERAARKVKGVLDLKTTVKALESGNLISLRVGVDGETSIPEITQQLQFNVKEQVEAIAGVTITEVAVVVNEVISRENSPARSRRVE